MNGGTSLHIIRLGFRWLLLIALIGALVERLLLFGPTIGDPDPEGYVSYARALAETWQLQWHRRLPGYPFIMLIVDGLGPNNVFWDMFWFHLGLTVLFALVTTLLVWRWVGFLTAALYLGILAINSHFARTAIVMFADLPHTVLLYLAGGAAALFLLGRTRGRWLWLAVFGVLALVSFVVHPSGDMRLQLFIWAGVFIAVLLGLFSKPFRPRLRPLLISLFALSATVYLAGQATQRFFQHQHRPETIHPGLVAASSADYLRAWLSYRMLLCLPPPREATAVDRAIEEAKAAVDRRLGYPTDAVVPPGYAPEFAQLFGQHQVRYDIWHQRLREHPFQMVRCAASEMRAKWHYLVRNLTPLTSFEFDKTFITPEYPGVTSFWRDQMFWRTGLSLFRRVGAEAPDHHVEAALFTEVRRLVVVLALTLAGLLMIDRRWPFLGTVFLLGTVGWFALLSVAVPVETRYFHPNMPIFYLGQAMVIAAMLRAIVLAPYWLGIGLMRIGRSGRALLARPRADGAGAAPTLER